MLAMSMTACDDACNLIIENHSCGRVTVHGATGHGSDFSVAPCSVVVEWPIGCSGGRAFYVTAEDSSGNIVLRERVSKIRGPSRGPARVDIVIPGEQGVCSDVVRDEYQLEVKNGASVKVAISVNNDVIGSAEAFGRAIFGPLAGPWYSVGIISAKSLEGMKPLRLHREFPREYELGQIPSVQVEIAE